MILDQTHQDEAISLLKQSSMFHACRDDQLRKVLCSAKFAKHCLFCCGNYVNSFILQQRKQVNELIDRLCADGMLLCSLLSHPYQS
jgi:hypothetical protein